MELKSPASFVNCFEKLLLPCWKIRPRFQQGRECLFLGLVMEPCVLRLLSVWIRSGFERSGMADTYVFFDCCGSCLFFLDPSTRLGCLSILPFVPQHVFVPVLRARRLPLPAFAPALLAYLLLEAVSVSPRCLTMTSWCSPPYCIAENLAMAWVNWC